MYNSRVQFAVLANSGRLDLLINSAGIVSPYVKTDDGFEILIGTNQLGHFALTGHLIETLKKKPGSRVVVVSAEQDAMFKKEN